MAQVVVRGTPMNVSKSDIIHLTEFLCDKLLKRLSHNIYVDIKMVDGLLQDSRCYGIVTWTDEDSRVPRDFKIEVDSGLSRRRMMDTIAHECVHIRQYARGELKDLLKHCAKKWRGEVYDDDFPYWKQPWEIEAHKKETPLVKAYKRHLLRQQ